MTRAEISGIVTAQRQYFRSGATFPVQNRISALKALYRVLKQNEQAIADALAADLGKSGFESYMCETGMALSEIRYLLRHVHSFARHKNAATPLAQFAARSYQKPSPYGVTLIMSPWNYPLLLTIDPLADAIAAGNTAVLKPSAYAPTTAALLRDLIGAIFPPEFVAVITGGREENTFLLDEKFDYVFFTGSKAVGQIVLEKAAKHLTPVTLELGGKSPCIIHKSADLKLAARRIVFGKFLNCGQTCVAPDYILCDEAVRDALIGHLRTEIRRQYGADPLANPSYGKIVNEKHFERIVALIDREKIVIGGEFDRNALRIAPTVLSGVTWNDPVMGEEIFGPVLPVLTFRKTDEIIDAVRAHDAPLALYVFSQNKRFAERITTECQFGGGCVNDVVIHLATSNMGFGGVGESGMGAYHGKAGFDTFTHYKSIVDKKTWIDLPMRYQPYQESCRKLVKFFLR